MNVRQSEPAESIDDVAACWIVRLSSENATPEDRSAFEAWRCKDPRNDKAFLRLERGNAFVERYLSDPVRQQLVEEARAETRPWPRLRAWPLTAIAASLLVTIGISAALVMSWISIEKRADHMAASVSYNTGLGERSTVTLRDGSIITLNTDSHVNIIFNADERSVALVSGQAYFEVAKDVERPFVVKAGDQRIIALGTAFDVRFDKADRFQVTLVEGRVSVNQAPDPDSDGKPFLNSTPEIRLNPGDRLVAGANITPQVAKVDLDEATSWRSGRLVFRSTPLAEAVSEMNRYSTQKLVLSDDARLKEMSVSGVFNVSRISTFVAALEAMHPLKAVRTGRQELTLMWQD